MQLHVDMSQHNTYLWQHCLLLTHSYACWCLLFVCLVGFRPIAGQSAFPIVRTTSSNITEEIILAQNHLSGSTIIATPKCWATAINIISGLQEIEAKTSADFCSELSQYQGDVLALELAKCHSRSSPTPFFEDEADSIPWIANRSRASPGWTIA